MKSIMLPLENCAWRVKGSTGSKADEGQTLVATEKEEGKTRIIIENKELRIIIENEQYGKAEYPLIKAGTKIFKKGLWWQAITDPVFWKIGYQGEGWFAQRWIVYERHKDMKNTMDSVLWDILREDHVLNALTPLYSLFQYQIIYVDFFHIYGFWIEVRFRMLPLAFRNLNYEKEMVET